MDRAICFDLDDTLYPYEQYVHAGFRGAAEWLVRERGVDVYDDLVAAYADGIRSRTFDSVLASHDLPDRFVDPMVEAFHDHIGSLEPYTGVPALLDRLDDEYRLALITDGHNGREKLAALGLDDRFEFVWVSPERGTSKRHSDPFEAAVTAVDVDPTDATYVGDHPKIDLAMPNRLGMETVRLKQGRYADVPSHVPVDAEVSSITDLPAVLD